jgi:cytochrome c peroxidase
VSSLEQGGFFLPLGPDPKNPHLLFNQSVSLPQYRFRFYTDGTRTVQVNPADFEAFDMPQLRGIAHTAPYFHDNSIATLADVIDIYSRFILPPITAIGLPAVNPPECPTSPPTCGLPPEALSPQDKVDLLAFLQTF